MTPRLTVVIPTFNHGALLRACLESIAAQTYGAVHIVVVDDASNDGSVAHVLADFPDVGAIRNDRNRGFAVSANRGIAESDTDYVMLLNNDVTLAPDCLARLVAALDDGQADMAQPLILWRDEPDTIYSAGDRQRANGRPESIGFREPRARFAFDEPVFGVTAAAAVYRRALLDRVGPLDESFGAYFEDSDLNFRARLAGFTAACVRNAEAWHVGSASQHGTTWRRTCYCYRNHALLVMKNMPARLLIRHAPAIIAERIHQTCRVIGACRAEFGIATALAIYVQWAIKLIAATPHALRARTRPAIAIEQLEQLLR